MSVSVRSTTLSTSNSDALTYEDLLISMFSTTIQEVQRYKERSNIALGVVDRLTSSTEPVDCTPILLDSAASAYYGYQNSLRGLHKTLRSAELATAKLENLLESGDNAQLLSSSTTIALGPVGPKKVLESTLESSGLIHITAVMASNWVQCLLLMQRRVVSSSEECDGKSPLVTQSLLDAMLAALSEEYSQTAAALLPSVATIDETQEDTEYCLDNNSKFEKEMRDESCKRATLIANTKNFLNDTGNKATSFTAAQVLLQASRRCSRVLRIVKPFCVSLDPAASNTQYFLKHKEKREALAIITGKLILRLGRLHALYLDDLPMGLTLLRGLVRTSEDGWKDQRGSSTVTGNDKSHSEYYAFVKDDEGMHTVQTDIAYFQGMHENASRAAFKGLKGRF
eukprot:Tbor_TRINITY_DN4398_c0_g1::TRINITY_DN4398_c0_g1_i1::g.7736::m.7736